MAIALDHIFILTSPGAPQADRLLELGFVEGSSNVHPGQGTANRRFFFKGFTIEFLFVSDADEAANGAGKELGLLARSRDRQASPFGLIVRTSDVAGAPGFPNWRYVPDFFDGKMCFYVGDNSSLVKEPLCICMPPELPKPSKTADDNPQWEFSSLKIAVPVEQPSGVLEHFATMDNVTVEYGKQHLMTLTLNNATANMKVDLSADSPLVLKY